MGGCRLPRRRSSLARTPGSGRMTRGADDEIAETDEPAAPGITRRALLSGAGATGIVALGTAGVLAASRAGTGADATGSAVAAAGPHQAGIDRPALPQQHCLLVIADVDTGALRASLASLGARVAEVTSHPAGLADLTPDGPGDLTVTVGLGATALAATAHPELADLVTLPDFAGDAQLPATRRGGDLLVSVNASDPSVL
ncbi:hypothetical protein FJ656_32310, partial [Schumannella luteola]